ncbi:MAG: sigma-70 family RNA polymerase sigma factor [Myxococcales bacterium]|nr:sigma-70 family RNA polymerase sigma factor [Myxococcales bacterium]
MTLTRDDHEALYRKHAPAAFRRAQRMLGSAADADEVVHEVFLRLFEGASTFLGASKLSTYLYSAVTHACLNRIRNDRTQRRLQGERAHTIPPHDPGTRPEWTVAAHDLLRRLPDPLAAVAVYYYLDELSQREIAELLGCSHVHVGKLLRRVRSLAEENRRASC